VPKYLADVVFDSQDEARIHVQSEDEPERTLLQTKITRDDGYQKQQGMNTADRPTR
jgi:protein phosphatase-4 regulatory subunit 3